MSKEDKPSFKPVAVSIKWDGSNGKVNVGVAEHSGIDKEVFTRVDEARDGYLASVLTEVLDDSVEAFDADKDSILTVSDINIGGNTTGIVTMSSDNVPVMDITTDKNEVLLEVLNRADEMAIAAAEGK